MITGFRPWHPVRSFRLGTSCEVWPPIRVVATPFVISRRVVGQGRSNCFSLTPEMKAAHSVPVNSRTAPVGFLLSRTPTVSLVRFAISTQSPRCRCRWMCARQRWGARSLRPPSLLRRCGFETIEFALCDAGAKGLPLGGRLWHRESSVDLVCCQSRDAPAGHTTVTGIVRRRARAMTSAVPPYPLAGLPSHTANNSSVSSSIRALPA